MGVDAHQPGVVPDIQRIRVSVALDFIRRRLRGLLEFETHLYRAIAVKVYLLHEGRYIVRRFAWREYGDEIASVLVE